MDESIVKKINASLNKADDIEFRTVKGGIKVIRVKREVIGIISENFVDIMPGK